MKTMPILNIICEGDNCWPDLANHPGLHALMGNNSPPIGMALLPFGTVSGQPTVCIRINLPDGKVVLTETTLALLDQAVSIFHAYLEGKSERG
jgi:hypothetical protein